MMGSQTELRSAKTPRLLIVDAKSPEAVVIEARSPHEAVEEWGNERRRVHGQLLVDVSVEDRPRQLVARLVDAAVNALQQPSVPNEYRGLQHVERREADELRDAPEEECCSSSRGS